MCKNFSFEAFFVKCRLAWPVISAAADSERKSQFLTMDNGPCRSTNPLQDSNHTQSFRNRTSLYFYASSWFESRSQNIRQSIIFKNFVSWDGQTKNNSSLNQGSTRHGAKIKKLKLATLMFDISLQDISGLQPESQFWESCVFNPSFSTAFSRLQKLKIIICLRSLLV